MAPRILFLGGAGISNLRKWTLLKPCFSCRSWQTVHLCAVFEMPFEDKHSINQPQSCITYTQNALMYSCSSLVGQLVVHNSMGTSKINVFASKAERSEMVPGSGKKRPLMALQIINPENLSVVRDSTAQLDEDRTSATMLLCTYFGRRY